MTLTKDAISGSVRTFKTRRDSSQDDDVATFFDHNFQRFLDFCRTDPLARRVLGPIGACRLSIGCLVG
jgi:hypothetical protein